ncbi:MAG TPA: hypothetical protein VKV28_09530 [Candidatus Binataceae bacterium]|nr:hypothetical protein [Candidatus Binataceae bacterium]
MKRLLQSWTEPLAAMLIGLALIAVIPALGAHHDFRFTTYQPNHCGFATTQRLFCVASPDSGLEGGVELNYFRPVLEPLLPSQELLARRQALGMATAMRATWRPIVRRKLPFVRSSNSDPFA